MKLLRKKSYRYAISSAEAAPKTAPILLLGSIEQNLVLAKSLGYDAIEVHLRENSLLDYDGILKQCGKHKVSIATIVTGRLATQEGVSLTDSCAEKKSAALTGAKKYIDIACAFGADIVIGWLRGGITSSKEEYNNAFGSAISELDGYAKERGVKIFIEAINRYEINSMNTAQDICELIERHNLKNTYAHLDTFHMNIEESDMEEAIKLCGKRLGYLHLADSNRQYPGAGHINFKKIAAALDSIDYEGYLSVECLPLPDYLPAAKKAIENLKKIF
ncbi:MAG: sugar phosphate isomerase/epimerase family protein [Christensenellales bacterium]